VAGLIILIGGLHISLMEITTNTQTVAAKQSKKAVGRWSAEAKLAIL